MAYGTLNVGAITPGSGATLTVSEAVTFAGAVNLGTPSAGVVTNLSGVLPVAVTGGSGLTLTGAVGMIASFGMASAPTGWIICDGATINRSGTYAALFAAISTTWGAGDGSSTFLLPDLRAAFLRGVGTSTGFTQNHATVLATKESDTLQGHFHQAASSGGQPAVDNTYNGFRTNKTAGSSYSIQISNNGSTSTFLGFKEAVTDASNGTPRTANETRPNNIGVTYCIKF